MISQLVDAVRCEGKCFPFLEQQPLNLGLLTLLYFHQVLGGCVLSLVCVSGSCCSAASGQAHLVSCLLPSLSVWLNPFPLRGRVCAGVGAASCSPQDEWGSASFLWNHPRTASAAPWLLAAQAASCSTPHTRQGILEIFIRVWRFCEPAWKQGLWSPLPHVNLKTTKPLCVKSCSEERAGVWFPTPQRARAAVNTRELQPLQVCQHILDTRQRLYSSLLDADPATRCPLRTLLMRRSCFALPAPVPKLDSAARPV